MNSNLHNPKGMRYVRTQTRPIKEAIIVLLIGVSILAIQGTMAEHEAAQAARDAEAKAMKLLQACLNGIPLATKDDMGRVVGAVFCQASKEQRL